MTPVLSFKPPELLLAASVLLFKAQFLGIRPFTERSEIKGYPGVTFFQFGKPYCCCVESSLHLIRGDIRHVTRDWISLLGELWKLFSFFFFIFDSCPSPHVQLDCQSDKYKSLSQNSDNMENSHKSRVVIDDEWELLISWNVSKDGQEVMILNSSEFNAHLWKLGHFILHVRNHLSYCTLLLNLLSLNTFLQTTSNSAQSSKVNVPIAFFLPYLHILFSTFSFPALLFSTIFHQHTVI